MGRRILGLDQHDSFEIDDDGRLYWQGERVLTEVRLTLPWAVNVAVIVASLATAGSFAITALQVAGMLAPPIAVTVVIDKSVIDLTSREGVQQ